MLRKNGNNILITIDILKFTFYYCIVILTLYNSNSNFRQQQKKIPYDSKEEINGQQKKITRKKNCEKKLNQ